MSVVQLLRPIGALVSFIRYKADRIRLKKLISRGLKVGKNVYIMEDVEFDFHYPFLIEIGDNCRIAKGVRILSHDATTFRQLGVTRIAQVKMLEGTFIGERAIILPGVTIGPRALIAAGSVVNRDIGEERAAAGNPARPYGKYSELISKYKEIARSATIFSADDIEKGTTTQEDLIRALEKDPTAFIRGIPSEDPFYINTNFAEMGENALRAYNRLESLSSSTETKPSIVDKKSRNKESS